MPETRIVGNDGAATVGTSGTHDAILDTWSANITQVISDVSGFGDVWAQKRGGLKGGTFSAGGHMSYDAATTAPGGDAIAAAGDTVTLTLATGCTISGTAVFGNVAYSSDVQGDATVTYDGEFTGTITETWDETP